jgi:calcineurin-like phosphoesterase family protein
MIYFTADTHFCHDNIIRLCQRPFANVDEMNQALIDNWNSLVSDRDEIYILGDFMFKGKAGEANGLLQSLKGRKYLIKGNHDRFLDDGSFNTSAFEWIKDYHVLLYEKRKFVLFHYPILEWDGFFHNAIHLFGHVHNGGNNPAYQERFNILGGKAINVGVDVNNFYPVSILDVIQMADGDHVTAG